MAEINARDLGNGGVIKQFCAKIWWLVLLRGISLLVLGILLVTRPSLTAVVLMQFVGAYFLVDGLFAIYHSFVGKQYKTGWGWGLLMGALEVLTGLIIFSQPIVSTIISAEILVFMVSFMAILFGVVGLFTWWQVRRDVNGGWGMLTGALLAIVVGVILLMYPEKSAKSFLVTMGVFGILGGLVQTFASFQIRKIGQEGLAALRDDMPTE